MTTEYLPDGTNFQDIPLKSNPKIKYPSMDNYVPCNFCHQRGGWNLLLNQYNPPNRHFQASCSNCNGWGWVESGSLDEFCIPHEYEEVSSVEINGKTIHNRMFEHPWKCRKCGKVTVVDSSG